MPNMSLKKYVGIIGIVLFIIILLNLNLSQLFQTMVSANPIFLGLSLIPMFFMLLFQAVKWKNILGTSNVKISFVDTTIMFLVGYYYGSITPGKIGDFIRSKYLSNHSNVSIGFSFSTVFLDRISDLIIIVYLGFIGVIFFIITYNIFVMPIFLLAFLFFGSIIFFYVLFNEKLLSKLVTTICYRVLPVKIKSQINPHLDDFIANLKLLTKNKKLLLQTVLLSALIWFITALGGFFLLLSLHTTISYPFVLFVIVISSLISLIPISINGLGTRELTIITLFSIIHVSPEVAFGFSLMFFCWNYLAVVPGVILFFSCKKKYLTI